MTTERQVPGTKPDEEVRTLYLSLYNQWHEVLTPGAYNWIDFTFAELSIEAQHYMGSWEFVFALLGLHVRLTYVYDPEPRKKMRQTVQDIRNGRRVFDTHEVPAFKEKIE